MPRAIKLGECLVVATTHIGVGDDEGERRTRRASLIESREEAQLIGLGTWGRPTLTTSPLGEPTLQQLLINVKPRGEAIEDAPYSLSVRLAEGRQSDQSPYTIHALLCT